MKSQKGISLISLIITIIVMVILAGIALTFSVEEGGVLTEATKAKQVNNEAELKEKIDFAVSNLEIKLLSNVGSTINAAEMFTEENLNKELESIGRVKEGTLVCQADGTRSFTFIDKNTNEELEYTYKLSSASVKGENIEDEKFIAQFENQKFDTLAEAIEAVPGDSNTYTVKLLKDTEECITIAANQSINLDLNGHEIKNDSNVITNQGILYVNGGSLISGASAITTSGKGVVIGEKSPCYLTGNGQASVIFSNMGGVDFYSGSITNSVETNAGPCVKMYENGANNEFHMYGGEIICNNGYGVFINNARGYIYAGSVTSTSKNGNACYSDGYLTFGRSGENGPTIKADGYTAIRLISHTTYIYSGNFEVKNSGNMIKTSGGSTYIYGGNFENISASDIIGVAGGVVSISNGRFKTNDTYCMSIKSGTIYISGGNFFGTKDHVLSRTGGTYSISGGTYNDITITEGLVKK